MNIYELFGHQAEQHQDAIDKFLKTLDLLRELKSGAIALNDVSVEGNGWNVKPAAPSDPSN